MTNLQVPPFPQLPLLALPVVQYPALQLARLLLVLFALLRSWLSRSGRCGLKDEFDQGLQTAATVWRLWSGEAAIQVLAARSVV